MDAVGDDPRHYYQPEDKNNREDQQQQRQHHSENPKGLKDKWRAMQSPANDNESLFAATADSIRSLSLDPSPENGWAEMVMDKISCYF